MSVGFAYATVEIYIAVRMTCSFNRNRYID